jgi:glycerol-3-phosphate dehydrogenase
MPGSGFIGRTAAHRQLPHLRADIIGLASYYDAWISQPERLGVELVLDALETNPGSACIPYGALEGREDGALVLRDPIEGAAVQIEGEIVVNAAGPWIDRVNRALGPVTRYIGGAKGSHLMLDHPELVRELAGRMIYFGTPDGRICLVFPFLGLALLGSTDIRVDDPDAARCDAAETAYMLGQLKTLFPGFEIDERHIVYRYCGVRPLPASDALDPGAVSRDHMVRVDEPDADRAFPVLSLIGGKWTTFRALAEEVADMLLARIGRDRTSHTRDLAIGGGRDFPRDDAARHKWIAGQAETSGLDQTRVGALLERYGTTAARVAAHCAGAQDAPLSSLPSYSRAELQELAEHELVGRLADVLFRRTTLAITGQLSRALVEEAAAAIAPTMGWDEPRQQAEIAATLETAAERHDVRL